MPHQAALHAVGVIPSRFGSTRFPGKPLALIAGRPMIERVHGRAREARRLDRLIVATDDDRIMRAVEGFGGEAMLTSGDHATGTDRLFEVARRVPADLYVNIQGDEPLLDPADIDAMIVCLDSEPAVEVATLAEPLREPREMEDPNVVKVVTDAAGRALYFSRAPIPYPRDPAAPIDRRRHVGLYAYRAATLREFAAWPAGTLERVEGLEQLRILERGRAIRVLPARGRYQAVDTRDDVLKVEQTLIVSSRRGPS
jgi:3-deoxy-manno-octulosonate cytidylyltransferase (CMP-KDO synthetase)